jgi:hypothetical protein
MTSLCKDQPAAWLNSILLRHLELAAILVFAIFVCGCQRTIIVLNSPSGHRQIEITRGQTFASRIQVALVDQGRSRSVFGSPGEADIYFADAYWSPDERIVGLVANGTGLFALAFDVAKGTALPFDGVRPYVEAAIRNDYRVPSEVRDAIQWTYSQDADEQFGRRKGQRK